MTTWQASMKSIYVLAPVGVLLLCGLVEHSLSRPMQDPDDLHLFNTLSELSLEGSAATFKPSDTWRNFEAKDLESNLEGDSYPRNILSDKPNDTIESSSVQKSHVDGNIVKIVPEPMSTSWFSGHLVGFNLPALAKEMGIQEDKEVFTVLRPPKDPMQITESDVQYGALLAIFYHTIYNYLSDEMMTILQTLFFFEDPSIADPSLVLFMESLRYLFSDIRKSVEEATLGKRANELWEPKEDFSFIDGNGTRYQLLTPKRVGGKGKYSELLQDLGIEQKDGKYMIKFDEEFYSLETRINAEDNLGKILTYFGLSKGLEILKEAKKLWKVLYPSKKDMEYLDSLASFMVEFRKDVLKKLKESSGNTHSWSVLTNI
ncbi:hypothetical protein CROQUDRAFT_687147 [Cronartium quercuum f. sp. fusiforme G11]|uniref:Uncharacterized protein n=1 Tax=Cronartium quercuum f. sp. fusiforme G11 TaxID=708437 RepID=A0A9P6N8Q0_9BASI|nr:hypothetical protein CROQUDRAFT_687147 [Cronartium quercuum f. sp. fusiforme G11]